jgi:hypothetical protein
MDDGSISEDERRNLQALLKDANELKKSSIVPGKGLGRLDHARCKSGWHILNPERDQYLNTASVLSARVQFVPCFDILVATGG